MIRKGFLAATGLTGVIAVSACASVDTRPVGDVYAGSAYVGATNPYLPARVNPLTPPVQYSATGAPVYIEAYEGIEGARIASATFRPEVAEVLDGRCEAVVSIRAGETINDIADLCDVDLRTLVAYNTQLANPYALDEGTMLAVPGGINTMAGDLVGLYTVAPGDTIERIAYRFNVDASAIANMNPKANFFDLKAGEQLRLPVETVRPAAGAAAVASASAPWEGYGSLSSGGAYPGGTGNYDIKALMPYNLMPAGATLADSAYVARPRLAVSEDVVKAGRRVRVTAQVRPGEIVDFRMGPNITSLSNQRTVRADQRGVASVDYTISRRRSDIGGVIVEAAPSEGAPMYSRRVGVVKPLGNQGGDSNQGAADVAEASDE